MAPLEPGATAHTNSLPFALFSGQILLVAGLTTHVLLTARRAAKSLPPSTVTRSQQPARRRHVAIFSILALLSLASVTTFAVMWRAASYFQWVHTGSHEKSPGGIWSGNYGTGDNGVGRWYLGDWVSDVDLFRASDAVSVSTPEGFVYTAQHFVGLAAASIFYGVEGHRRNLTPLTIASFVTLSAIGSLGYAISLFFITILFTPLALHSSTEHGDALFTPKPAVYYVPVIVSFLFLHFLPDFIAREVDIVPLRLGYLAVPLFLAFAPQIIPPSWGTHHLTKASAHRSYIRAFHVLSISSFLLYWTLFGTTILDNRPPQHNSVYDLLKHSIGKHDPSKTDRILSGIAATASRLKLVSKHPLISATGSDVFFTVLNLLTWTFIRNLDVDSILENSILSFLAPAKENKHVEFSSSTKATEAEIGEILDSAAEAAAPTPKKRGRPRKATINGATTSSASGSQGTLRRSTRRNPRSDYESEAEDLYEPTAAAKEAVNHTETDGVIATKDLVHSGESTALALFLAFAGGLGQLAAGVLGAEATETV